jgi:hypothetical protein
MEATCSFETSFDFQRTTRRYIREDRTLQESPSHNIILNEKGDEEIPLQNLLLG